MRWWVVFVVLCFVAGAANAQSKGKEKKDAQAQAAKLYEKAEADYKLQKYQEALAGFEEAYRLTNEPQLLFNLGQCYRQLDRLDDARKSFESFLRDAPKNSPLRESAEERLNEVNAELARLASKGAIQISSQQDPTNVFLDDQPKGQTPLLLKEVEPGEHKVTIKKDGFAPYEITIVITPAETFEMKTPKLVPLEAMGVSQSKVFLIAGVGLGGAGVVSAGGFLLFGLRAASLQNQLDLAPGDSGDVDNAEIAKKRGQIEQRVTLAKVSGGFATGFLVAAATSLSISYLKKKKAPAAPQEQP